MPNPSNSASSGVFLSRRWHVLETVGRCMFLLSVVFFVGGVTLTVFGFTGSRAIERLPLQILGPICLVMTAVMWILGCLFSRMWNLEWKRYQQAFHDSNSGSEHAQLTFDVFNPKLSPEVLQRSRMRRQLMQRMREQMAMELSSDGSSREETPRPPRPRSKSTALIFDTKRQSVDYVRPRGQSLISQNLRLVEGPDGKMYYQQVPGIEISRIDTLEGFDRRNSAASRGSRASQTVPRFILLGSNELLPVYPSDYSLSVSGSSRKSSRASSNVSSRMWDFSPRESEWDADVSVQSKEDSQQDSQRPHWEGYPYEIETAIEYVPSARLIHSNSSNHIILVPQPRYSPDLSNRPVDETLREPPCGSSYHTSTSTSESSSSHESKGKSVRSGKDSGVEEPVRSPLPSRRSRAQLKRDNTDDSEVARRVARLMRQIQYSITESVDESKIRSSSGDFTWDNVQMPQSNAREAQTQTSLDNPMIPASLLRSSNVDEYDDEFEMEDFLDSAGKRKKSRDSGGSRQSDEEKSKFLSVSSFFNSFGRSKSSGERKSRVPRHICLAGISPDDEIDMDVMIRSPPPAYESIMKTF